MRQDTLEASELPPRCTQFIPVGTRLSGSEDCLYLNIWTPSEKAAEPLPVMVWFHGGGFILGEGAYRDDDGRELAKQGVVVVSVNYRLGVFGFLAHPALAAENPDHPSSGNYGIEDQTAALRWVRDNISAFGGDPDRVTIFGQSAGAVSICAQLASPLAAGLFHRAVIQSGPCVTPMSTMEAASTLGKQLSQGLECDHAEKELDCMREAPAEDVASVLPPDPSFAFGTGYAMWWPVLDGSVLPLQFEQAFESGRFNQVPVINGATRDEASLLIWIAHDMRFKPLLAEQYIERLQYLTGSPQLAEEVRAQYPLEDYDSPLAALTAAFSDGFFNCPARRQGFALSRHVPVWSYQFDYEQAPFFIPWADLGAFHSAEIQYVFGMPMTFFRGDFAAGEQELAGSMMAYWQQFADHGNPNGNGPASWPVFDERDQTLLFNLQTSVATGVHKKACVFWQALPYLRPPYP